MRALICVDVQNDFIPGGALQVPDGHAVVDPINQLMPLFDLVVLTADWHPADHVSFATNHSGESPYELIDLPYGKQVLWPAHCVAGTLGASFVSGLDTIRASAVIRKGMRRDCDSYSGFLEADRKSRTGLEGYLRERCVDEVFVVGLALDFCVSWTALDAASAGFKTSIVTDACRAIDLNGSLQDARDAWKAAGVCEVTAASLELPRAYARGFAESRSRF